MQQMPLSNAPPSLDEILSCQFKSWFKDFRNLPATKGRTRKNVTIKSKVIDDLPEEFLRYLQSDGVRLPREATRVSTCVPPTESSPDGWSSDESDLDQEEVSFPQITSAIASAIEQLGGSAIPKLNWSAPKDATWINGGTLRCQHPGDVYLLLKSSDFVMHDLLLNSEDRDQGSIRYHLVLRRWCNLHASMEFRCFVYNRQLIAISQRNHTQHFPHVVRDRNVFRAQIMEFHDGYIKDYFVLERYIFDVYIDKQACAWLVDFNVWGSQTDPLLFDWNELGRIAEATVSLSPRASDSDGGNRPIIRVVETENSVRQDPLASYRAPIDAIELAASGSTDFEDFIALCEKPSGMSDC